MLSYAVLLVAVMSERSPFLPKRQPGENEDEERTGGDYNAMRLN